MKSLPVTLGAVVAATQLLVAADPPAASRHPGEVNDFTGKVVETTNAASYTYVLVDTGREKLWAAAPQFAVKVGDHAQVTQAMPMPNYHSKTLKRDFPLVYFTGSIAVNGKPAGAAAAGQQLPQGHPPIGGGAKSAALDFSTLKKPAGGKTVAEIVTGRAKLSGKPVQVRGKVVKYNAMIMGKNWLHIRDGSGTEGSNDLTVTTATAARVGDTVLVSGKVSLNRDFGGGYRYAVILEDATVTVE